MTSVKVGDMIKCRDGKAIITNIQDGVWDIEWQSRKYKEVCKDKVPSLLQHNWRKIIFQTKFFAF